jgi:hypothetical protein
MRPTNSCAAHPEWLSQVTAPELFGHDDGGWHSSRGLPKRTDEIGVVGALGTTGRKAFLDVPIEIEPTAIVLTADLDQAGLHLSLDWVRDLGLGRG